MRVRNDYLGKTNLTAATEWRAAPGLEIRGRDQRRRIRHGRNDIALPRSCARPFPGAWLLSSASRNSSAGWKSDEGISFVRGWLPKAPAWLVHVFSKPTAMARSIVTVPMQLQGEGVTHVSGTKRHLGLGSVTGDAHPLRPKPCPPPTGTKFALDRYLLAWADVQPWTLSHGRG